MDEVRLPHVFVGSSSKTLSIVYALKELLSDCAIVVPWEAEGNFEVWGNTLDSIIRFTEHFDFGIFVLGPDDLTIDYVTTDSNNPTERNYQEVYRWITRGNVLLELGVFLGRLDRNRTYYITPRSNQILNLPFSLDVATRHNSVFQDPSDLRGLTTFLYSIPRGGYPSRDIFTVDAVTDEMNVQKQEVLMSVKEAADGLRKKFSNEKVRPERFLDSDGIEIVKEIDRLRETIVRKYDCSFKHKPIVIHSILKQVGSEIERTLDHDVYRENITTERNFLVRAQGMFNAAETVFATSIDRLSKFWIAPDLNQRALALEYTNIQPEYGTHRIFVFSDASSAHSHRNVLAAHHARYGRGGGVYFCSWKQYQGFLSTALGPEEAYNFDTYSSDFALMRFKSQDVKCKPGSLYEARLSDSDLTYYVVPEGNSAVRCIEIAYSKLIDSFNNLTHSNESFSEEYGIAKWYDAYKDNNRWSEVLRNIFAINCDDPNNDAQQSGDVFHLVFFSSLLPNERMSSTIADISQRLKAIAPDAGAYRELVKEVWFGSYTPELKGLKVTDPIGLGQLRTTNKFLSKNGYCLILRLDNTSDLKEYYGSKLHGRIRKVIYEGVCPQVIPLYNKISSTSDANEKSEIFQRIEQMVSRYIIRADYVRDDDIEAIVERVPPAFSA